MRSRLIKACARLYRQLDQAVEAAVIQQLGARAALALRCGLTALCIAGLCLALWRPQSAAVVLLFPLLVSSFFAGPRAGLLFLPLAVVAWTHAHANPEAPDVGLFLAQCLFSVLISGVTSSKYRELHDQRRQLLQRLELAREVQKSMEPPRQILIGNTRVQTNMEVCDALGGDFVAARPLPDGGLLLLLGDVQGKGPQAALTAAYAVGVFDESWRSGGDNPEKLLQHLHELLDRGTGSRFVTAVCLRADATARRWRIANAGHPRPIAFGAGPVRMLGTGGMVLGLRELFDVGVEQVELAAGERLLLLSDGCYEEEAVTPALQRLLRPRTGMEQILEWLRELSSEHVDDRTVVLVEGSGGNPGL